MQKENTILKKGNSRPSRRATSLTLKCSVSKSRLDDLEKAFDKLEMDTDDSLSKMQENKIHVVEKIVVHTK
jgi:hypothetical protein